jgi:hypothetical protein
MGGQSLLSVAGWWVAWVYALSLALPMLLGPLPIPPPEGGRETFDRWAREVVFSSPGWQVAEGDAQSLLGLKAVANSPAPVAGNVLVGVEELTAKAGADYEIADSGVEIHFDKGAVEGDFREVPGWGAGVRIAAGADWKPPRSFRLKLQTGTDALAAGDLAICTVTIDDGPKPSHLDLISVGFARDSVAVSRAKLATTAIEVAAESPASTPVPIAFDLYQILDGERRPLGKFEKVLPVGEKRMSVCVADAFTPEEIEKLGLADDGLAGADDTYELDLMAPPPMFPGSPRTCRLVAANTNQPPTARTVFFDRNKRVVDWLDPEGFVTLEYDDPMRNETRHVLTIDGRQLPDEVVIDPRARRGRLVSLAGHDWTGRSGRRCHVGSACGRGCCKGQGGCSGKALCGEPVPGDFMLLVVNNERLHDPGDGIVEEVRRALADGATTPYGKGAIIVNPDGEDVLTSDAGGPDPKKMFQPFGKQGHDVAGQLKRVEQVVARRREAAANPDLRAVVIWPERDLAAGRGVRRVEGEYLRPMSFLLPDADPSYVRAVETALMPRGTPPRDVTVRAPKEWELEAHIENVIAEDQSAVANAP